MDNYSNNNNSENGNLNDMMMQEFANMIGDIEVNEIDNYEKCEFIYKEFYRKYNTLIPLIEFFEDNLPMQEYIRSLGSKFHIEDNEADKNNERRN